MATAAAGRHGNLDRSFRIAARSLLTAFSREDVNRAFPSFTDAEKERLYQMFIYVTKSLHGNIESYTMQFTWDESSFSYSLTNRTSIKDIKERISKEKEDEIKHLKGLLEKTEEEINAMKPRIEHLKEGEDFNHRRDGLKEAEAMDLWLSELQWH